MLQYGGGFAYRGVLLELSIVLIGGAIPGAVAPPRAVSGREVGETLPGQLRMT